MVAKTLKTMGTRFKVQGTPWEPLFMPYHGDEVISIDCETTGLNPLQDDLLTLAAVKIRDGKIMTSEKLDIRLPASPKQAADSIRIHRIRKVDLEDGVGLDQALPRFLDFIGNRPLLGYYINFDVTLLNRYIQQAFGFELPNPTLELADIYASKERIDETADRRLETILNALGVPVMGRHTAIGDATMVAMAYVKLMRR
ncbi:3'-5' exonuclease [Litorivicinus lipolyticus]|nr:3'-5' exonuclease [Litorivicinus lipolyticus]